MAYLRQPDGSDASPSRLWVQKAVRLSSPRAIPLHSEKRFGVNYPDPGTGFLAGEFPDGITTVEGAPTSATVRALYRPERGGPADGMAVAEVQSAADGTWVIEGLNPDLKYDVVVRKEGYNDVMVANVSPWNPPRLTVSAVTAYVAQAFNYVIPVIGGHGTLTVAVSGTLPSGISFSAGTLSGVWPTGATGEYPVAVTVTDGNGDSTSKTLTILLSIHPLVLPSSAIPSVFIGQAFSHSFSASGGEGPYIYSISGGALPAGLSLDASSGLLSGTTTAGGAYSYTVTVTDARSQTSSRTVSGTANVPHKYWRINITASNNHASVTEIEMSADVGGPDLCVGGTIVSSGTYPASDCNMAYAFDDATSGPNCWASNVSTAGWIGYAFASPVAISEVRIWARVYSSQTPRDFSIEYSDDGVSYTAVSSYTGLTSWPNGFVAFSGW